MFNDQNSNQQFNNNQITPPNNNQGRFNNIQNNNFNQNPMNSEVNPMMEPNTNRFISSGINPQENSLNSLNIDTGDTNSPRIDYSNDPIIQEKMEQMNNPQNKKNTITITSEGKVFLVIIAVLLIFIFVLPTIFDYLRDIQYK